MTAPNLILTRLQATIKGSLLALFLIGGALTSTDAQAALSCQEILNMVSVNVPSHIIVQTMEGSGTQFSADDVRCLAEGGAPTDIVDTARKMAATPEPEPAAVPSTTPEPETKSAFDAADALGSALPEGEDGGESATACSELDKLIKAYKAKRVLTASYGLFEMLEKDACPAETSRIHYYLAKSLFDLKMYHSAQHYFFQVVRRGPKHPYFKYALPKMVQIATLTGNDKELLRIVHKIPPETYPAYAKDHLFYLMGRKQYEAEKLSEAARYFGQVSPKSDLFLKAKYFEGVIHKERSKYRSAVKSFTDVYRAEVAPMDQRQLDEINSLKDLALINIARIYFELKNFDTAKQYYSQVDHGSIHWPQALFEQAYTNFYLNDLNGSLGYLLTVVSPYYMNNTFVPEATILRALAFFQFCSFQQVGLILNDFEAKHRPMYDEISLFLEKYSTPEAQKLSDEAYDTYFDSNKDSALTKALFARILENSDLNGLVSHMDIMDQEILAIEKQKTQWRDRVGVELVKQIESDRSRYKKYAGSLLLQEMAAVRDMLGDLLNQSDIILFEVVEGQRKDLEHLMMNPEVQSADEKKIDFAVSKTIIYWPFNGEFWMDELGYHRYAENSACN